MLLKEDLKRGDIISYKKEIMYKGMIDVKSKIVAIVGHKILLENGDMIFAL
ncbi:hypothetical protein IUY40_02755 [Flavobacterium sp. ALJ2]|uniref:hypothetical protein n=1 Tax=Flavobacterium sp. ALJ2 TaxID=2786960 RepID=UPI00189EB1D0|nr:hypothetical protein [Flavobacterium sp. ALJ2]MBF7090465.1 hypothetical protein [Flavobacterium sp. ALJ2]